jgi:hypothetical protein
MRQMSNIAADTSKFTPEQMAEMGRRINPAQQVFGPKDPKIEELQRFFQVGFFILLVIPLSRLLANLCI